MKNKILALLHVIELKSDYDALLGNHDSRNNSSSGSRSA